MGKTKSRRIFCAGVFAMLAVSCAGHAHKEQTLQPPAGAEPAARRAMVQGNQLFADHRLEAARKEYEAAIKIQPSLAEAHYNLALTLEQLGNPKEARHHYLEAANLAPGNKVIWNSPPLRRYGNVQPKSEYEASESGGGHSH